MPCERKDFLAGLDVPQLSGVVHTSGGDEHAMGVERKTDNFHFVPFERVVALAGVGIPNLGFLVEGACHDFVTEWIIKGHAVDDVRVFVQAEDFLARVGVPNLAGSVVAARDKSVSILVKRTIGQGEQVRPQYFKEGEFLLLILHLLLNQLFDQFFELGFAGCRN